MGSKKRRHHKVLNEELALSEKTNVPNHNPAGIGLPAKTRTIELLQFGASCALIVISVIALVIYGGQLNTMQGTLGLERPWIGSLSPVLHPTDNTQRLGAMEWRFQNGGRSTAIHTKPILRLFLGPTAGNYTETNYPKNPECDKPPGGTEGGGVAIPGLGPYLMDVSVTPEIASAMDDIYANKKGLYLVGCIFYTDSALSKWYRTDITMVFHPTATAVGYFEIFKYGNDAI